MTPRQAVQDIKREMASLSSSGYATHFRGIIVTPEVWDALGEDSEGFHGVMRVSGTEGNSWIRYSFYVLADPSLTQYQASATYVFVHHIQEEYGKKFLGKVPAVMVQERRKMNVAGCSIEELNPFSGVVTAGDSGRSRYFYQVDYDDVVAVAKAALASQKNIDHALYARFERYNLVHNPPETRWLGKLEFEKGRLIAVETPNSYPFFFYKKPDKDWVGRLLMERMGSEGSRIVGIARDARGKIHVVPMPESKFTDPWEFAKVAIRYFLPEEIFVVLGMKQQEELDKLRVLPVTNWWGDWCDYERAGRIQEYGRSGPRGEGFALSVDCINTRAKESNIEIAYFDKKDKTEWEDLRAKYFPPDWEKWPDTKMDKAFSAMAATL